MHHLTSMNILIFIKPYKNLWGLKNFRQKNLEEYLGIQRIDKLSGKKLIKTYQDYLDLEYTKPSGIVVSRSIY